MLQNRNTGKLQQNTSEAGSVFSRSGNTHFPGLTYVIQGRAICCVNQEYDTVKLDFSVLFCEAEYLTYLCTFVVFTDNKMEPLVNYGVKWFVWKVCFCIMKGSSPPLPFFFFFS